MPTVQSLAAEMQGRIQGISKRGARSRRFRILRSKVCFDAPSNIPYVFVRRVVNNIHIVNTACWLKSKYLRAGPGSALKMCVELSGKNMLTTAVCKQLIMNSILLGWINILVYSYTNTCISCCVNKASDGTGSYLFRWSGGYMIVTPCNKRWVE